MKIEQLRETHWHKGELAGWDYLRSKLPEVIETNLKLWALRIQRSLERKANDFMPHSSLYAITCTRYASRADGVFAPVEPLEELTFLVVADGTRAAHGKVQAQLRAHGYEPDKWAMTTGRSEMVLV